MFKLLVLLLVSLVAGNLQVSRPWLLGTPSFSMHSHPLFPPQLFSAPVINIYNDYYSSYGSPYEAFTPISKVNFDQEKSVQDWALSLVESRASNSKGDIQSSRNFFSNQEDLNDAGTIVEAAVPHFNIFDPFNLFGLNPPDFYPNRPRPPWIWASLTRPAIRTVTNVMTVTSTIVTPIVTLCISSNQFATPANPTNCAVASKRRRSLEEDDLVSPSRVLDKDVVLPTLVPDSRAGAVNYEIESSKEEITNEDQSPIIHPSLLRQERRFGQKPSPHRGSNWVTLTTTSIVYAFTPMPVRRAVTPVNPPGTGQNGALLCIPPGYVVC